MPQAQHSATPSDTPTPPDHAKREVNYIEPCVSLPWDWLSLAHKRGPEAEGTTKELLFDPRSFGS